MIASALVTGALDSPPVRVLHLARTGAIRVLASEAGFAECRDVLLRKRLRRRHGHTVAEIDLVLREIRQHARLVATDSGASEGPDVGDAHLWQVLRADSAAVLVTGDRALRESPPAWARDRAMTPREWIDAFETGEAPSNKP